MPFALFNHLSLSYIVLALTSAATNLADIALIILRDPAAVSQARRKDVTKVFKHRQKSPWVPTLTGPFPNGQANAGSSLGTKECFVLLCSNGEQHLLSVFREFAHDSY